MPVRVFCKDKVLRMELFIEGARRCLESKNAFAEYNAFACTLNYAKAVPEVQGDGVLSFGE